MGVRMVISVNRITDKDVANHFQVSKSTILKWTRDGIIEFYRLPSGHLRFEKDKINEFAKKYKMPEMK